MNIYGAGLPNIHVTLLLLALLQAVLCYVRFKPTLCICMHDIYGAGQPNILSALLLAFKYAVILYVQSEPTLRICMDVYGAGQPNKIALTSRQARPPAWAMLEAPLKQVVIMRFQSECTE
jgi:hypothetical protein